jgi:hypothetical protein
MHVVRRAKKERGKSSACGKSVRDVRKKRKEPHATACWPDVATCTFRKKSRSCRFPACNRLLTYSSRMHVKKKTPMCCMHAWKVEWLRKKTLMCSLVPFFFVVKNLWLKTGAIVLLKFYEFLTI